MTVTHSSLTFNPLQQPNTGKAVSDELPKLFTDEEFNEQRLVRERRELADRRIAERRSAPRQLWLTDGLPESTLEQKFPHIAQKLAMLWGSGACAPYISNLAFVDRGVRQGFPEEVLEDLMMLYEINEMLINKPGLGPAAATPPA